LEQGIDNLNEDDYNSIDILGHEFTHGVDQYTAELEYQFESGALDESFADIFGEWVQQQALGST
jgi:Zn-dependent metalloprotease